MSGLKLTALFVLLAAAVSCGAPGSRTPAPAESQADHSLMAAVPSDALVVLSDSRCSEGLALLDSANVLRSLDLGQLKNARMVLSFCYSGSLVPILSIDAGRTAADSTGAVADVISKASGLGLKAALLSGDQDSGKRNILVITPSETQFAAVRRHLSEHSSIMDAHGFSQALQLAGSSRSFVIFRGNGVPRYLPADFLKGIFTRRQTVNFMQNTADWAVCCQEGNGHWIIRPATEGTGVRFAEAMDRLPVTQSHAGEILPADTRFAIALPVPSPDFRGSYESYLDANVRLGKYNNLLSTLRKESGKNPPDWEKQLGIKEVALAVRDSGNVVLVRPGKAAADLAPEENPYRGFTAALYGEAFSTGDDSFRAATGGWLVIGSEKAVKAFISCEERMPATAWPGKSCKLIAYTPDNLLCWGKKDIELWSSNR